MMRFSARPLLALALLALLAACVTGCFNPFRPLVAGFATHVDSAPVPSGAKEVVMLFKWCWENRDITQYREIFTDDYRFAFATTDSAGNLYRTNPWTREDELISAQNLFVSGTASEPSASNITLIFDGDLTAGPDYRDGKKWPWHKTVQIANLTLTVTKSDNSALRVTGGALFFLVRGDSAVIPQELLDRGFKRDTTRWYIERWEDQTNTSSGAASIAPAPFGGAPLAAPGSAGPARPAASVAATTVSWGYLKRLWHGP